MLAEFRHTRFLVAPALVWSLNGALLFAPSLAAIWLTVISQLTVALMGSGPTDHDFTRANYDLNIIFHDSSNLVLIFLANDP